MDMRNCNSDIYWEMFVIDENNPIDAHEIERILEFNNSGNSLNVPDLESGKTKHYFYWKYKTPEIKSISPDDLIDPLLGLLSDKADELSTYLLQKNLTVKFYLVIKYHSGVIPSMSVSNQFVKICYKLNAVIEQDIYSDYEVETNLTIEVH